MNSTRPPLLITFLSLLLCLDKSYSQSIDHQYEACKPFECGGVNISYPFYFPPKQPSWCGLVGFNVSCNNKSQIIISLSGDDYITNHIFYQNMSIKVTNSAFSSSVFGCASSIHNLTFHDDLIFNFTSEHKSNILLLQSCSGNITSSNKNYTEIKCVSDHEKLWAVYEDEFVHQNNSGVCGEKVLVPYYEDEDENHNSGIEGILRRGIMLKYQSNNCSRCVDSGGRCGMDESTMEFQCFCPDRPHNSSCHHQETKHNNGKKWKIVLASVFSLTVLIILLLLIFCWQQRNKRSGQSTLRSIAMTTFNRARSGLDGVGSMRGVTVFSYRELEEATHGFDPIRELGEGGFGIVYYGKLKDGREVAVKRLYEKNHKRIEQFKNEIELLTDLRHPNLVTLYGCTTRHSRELLLVYEFIPNGTVADHVHKPSLQLPWSTRINIAIETSTALSYLHSNDIIHRDVKTTNILLDSNFSVKVADFGLSRLFPADVTHVSTAPQGTPGYLDPEYHQCYHLTDKSDVYSFGVVLVELISSLPAVDVGRHRHEINLSNYAMTRIQRSAFSDLVDPDLGFETDFKVRRMTTLVAELAFRCLQHERELRPSMEEVVEVLTRIVSMDYDALEAEEVDMSTGKSAQVAKPPPSPTDSDDVRLLRNAGLQPPSPVSVMDKWLNSSKSTTPATSRSS